MKIRLSHLEKLIFTKHLSVMIHSGIPLGGALEILGNQAKSSSLRQVITAIHQDVNGGSSLENSMKRFPLAFDNFYLGIINIGEASGNLDNSLNYLAQQLSKEHTLRKKVSGALMYPALVLIATLILGSYVSIFILPKLVVFFTAFESKLPTSTIILLRVAVFMKDYGLIFIPSLLLSITGLILLARTRRFRPLSDRLILRLPLVGPLIQESELSRLSRNLSLLIKSGVPISRALDITARSLTNLTYQTALLKVASELQSGKAIAASMDKINSRIFPKLLTNMIAVGEKTGRVDESLMFVSEFYDEDIDESVKNLTTSLEPALLIFIGLIVGFMAMAIISPIYQLTSAIGQ